MGWFSNLFGSTPQPICRHTAVMAAMLYGENYDVRLISGQTEAGPHMQAMALIAGKWEWLEASGSVHIGKKQYDFTGFLKSQTLKEYMGLINSTKT